MTSITRNGRFAAAVAFLVVVVTAGAPVVASAKSKIIGAWREPDGPAGPYRKVVALALAGNDANRRAAEDEFVKRLPKGVEGVRSYEVIPKEDEGNVDKVVARLRAAGVDGAAVLRVVNQDTRVVYDPGSYWRPYYTFQSYYGDVWSTYHDPGYLVPESAVHVETAFYSVTDAKLVWTGYSETINPKKAQDVIDDVAKLMVGKLRKEKLFP
jgi:hypothetical protein